MKRKVVGLTAVLLMAVAGAVQAEQRAGAFTLSPFAGGYTFDGVQSLETRPTYGLRLGYDFTKSLGLEATFGYVNTKSTGNPRSMAGRFNSLDVFNYRLELLYNFNADGKFVPFMAVGTGGSSMTGLPGNARGQHKTNNDATAQAGIGFKYFLTEDAALRADGRVIGSFHSTPAFEISKHEYWINYEYTLGLEFLFGGKKPVVAKVEPPPPPPPAPKPVEPPPPAPVDCKVSPWSAWGSCSAACGGGTQTRTRTVTTQPANGGAVCPVLTESRACNTQACTEEEKINLLIEFDFNKAVIKKEFYPNVDAVGEFLKRNSTVNVTLDGWTDKIGTDKYNKKLSQRRADAVKKYLVDKYQINPARITAVGHGKSFKYDNKTASGRYKNRRVEMNQTVIVPKK